MGETVVERQDDQRAPCMVDIDARERLLHIRRIVAVRQDDAFRVGCRAGCISNRRVVVIFDRQGGVEERYQRMGRQVFFSHTYHFGKRDLFFAVFRLIVHHDHLLDKGQAVHDGAYLL